MVYNGAVIYVCVHWYYLQLLITFDVGELLSMECQEMDERHH